MSWLSCIDIWRRVNAYDVREGHWDNWVQAQDMLLLLAHEISTEDQLDIAEAYLAHCDVEFADEVLGTADDIVGVTDEFVGAAEVQLLV